MKVIPCAVTGFVAVSALICLHLLTLRATSSEDTLPIQISALKQPDLTAVRDIQDRLVRLARGDKKVSDALVVALCDEDELLSGRAASTLALVGPKAVPA